MKKCLVALLFVVLFCSLPTTTLAQTKLSKIPQVTSTPSPTHKEGQLIIKFKTTTTQKTIKKKLKEHNMRKLYSIDELSVLVVEIPHGQEKAILKKLNADKTIIYAEPDFLYRYELTATDPSPAASLSAQPSNKKTWALENIHAPEAWRTSRGTGVIIGIIDSGFEIEHPALSGKIIKTEDFSGENSLADIIGHGTRVAGIIAGSDRSPEGMTGICPDCRLLLAKLGKNISSATIARAIMWATKNGAQVINLSVVTEDYSNLAKEAINYAWERGAVIVAAAGNGNSSDKTYPAAYNNVVAVAAIDEKGEKAPFSNYGDWVMLTAPGVNIYTSQKNESYGYASGTSIASPIVAGVAGLVWASKHGTSNETVVQQLCNKADRISGTDTFWRCGKINAEAAVQGESQTNTKKVPHKSFFSFVLSLLQLNK